MPVAVHLEFTPPVEEDITSLHIFEAPASTGPFLEIEQVTAIGTFPDYIDHYTTTLANSLTDWFSIQWKDSKGALTPLSASVQGGTTSLVGKLIQRVLQRDSGLDPDVVKQEAEGAIEWYFHKDPYDNLLTASYRQLNGLTYLILARANLIEILSSQGGGGYTAGMVTEREGTTTSSMKSVNDLIKLANQMLNINTSVVMQLEELQLPSGSRSRYDASRGVIDITVL